MKFLKMFGIMTIILSAIICTGCSSKSVKTAGDTDGSASSNPATVHENEAPEDEQITQEFGKFGMGLDIGNKFYFWKFSSDDVEGGGLFSVIHQTDGTFVDLVCLEGENETVIRSVETASEFAANEKGLYYTSGEAILFAAYGSKEEKHCDFGTILGITENGRFVIYSKDNTDIWAVDTSDNTVKNLYENTRFVAIDGNTIFHAPTEDYEAASKGLISLHSMNPENGYDVCLFTSDGNLYDGESLGIVDISKIVFAGDYVYFSYGAVAGSGSFYQGGDIVRAKRDGSASEVLVDISTTDEFVDAHFVVNEDGTVSTSSELEALYDHLEETDTERGIITYTDPATGQHMDLCSYRHDASYDSSTADLVSITDKYVFFVTHYGTRNPEKDIGWREYYERDKSVFSIYDRKTLTYFYSYTF